MQFECGVVPLSFLGFIAFWSFVVWLISLFGWARLARQYRDLDHYQGRKLRMRSGRIGASSYNSVLTIGADFVGGTYLSTRCSGWDTRHSSSHGVIFGSKGNKGSS